MIAVSSITPPVAEYHVAVENATDKGLRKLLDWPNNDTTREQLLAACKNRGITGFIR